MEIKVLDESDVIFIHDAVLAESGGLSGLASDKSLPSALHRIYNCMTYQGVSDIHEIAALYAIALAQGHVFNDGNKRTAMISMVNLLLLNSITLTVPNEEIENKMVDIAEKKVTTAQLKIWIKKYSIAGSDVS